MDVEVASERTNAALCAWCGCTTAAMETADVVLMDSNLTKMPLVISIGRATLFKIRENLMIAMVTKGLMLALTMANVSSLYAIVKGGTQKTSASCGYHVSEHVWRRCRCRTNQQRQEACGERRRGGTTVSSPLASQTGASAVASATVGSAPVEVSQAVVQRH